VADEIEVTADDMEAAAERIAVREGVTVEGVRERVRRGDVLAGDAERTCALPGCDRTFVPRNVLHRYCRPAHRAAGHRGVRTGGAS
jgi:hypothetical protein